jgi:hypothetical protein
MNPMRRSPSLLLDIMAEPAICLGCEGGGCHFDNVLSFLMNFHRPTTGRTTYRM